MLHLIILIKLMLVNLYYSTDFDVHRNWMRITTEQPIQLWYYDTESEWTLDYPPMFAYLEFILGSIAKCLRIDLHLISNTLVYYQRITVIITELLYYYAIQSKGTYTKTLLDVIPFGALLIDNIHFQYNGLLYGIMLFTCLQFKNKRYLHGSLLFTILLCTKHIYIYILPAIGITLLQNCTIKQLIRISIYCIALGLTIFLPFLAQLPKVLSQMFPFQRGLVHSYWAQNFWAIYCSIDKVIGRLLGINKATTASGTVQVTVLNVLPQISPIFTILLIFILCLVFLRKKQDVYRMASISSLIFFNFGYHVHEKAIMIPLILQMVGGNNIKLTFLAQFVNGISLLPLIPTQFGIIYIYLEQPILISMLAIYSILYFVEYRIKLNKLEQLYILGGYLVIVYSNTIHPLIGKYEFLPLMLYSLYGAIFNQYWLYKLIMTTNNDDKLM